MSYDITIKKRASKALANLTNEDYQVKGRATQQTRTVIAHLKPRKPKTALPKALGSRAHCNLKMKFFLKTLSN